MSGPERLEHDPRPTRRRTWVVAAAVVLVVAGLGAVRVGGLAHEPPAPPVPSSSPTRSATATWPREIGTGTLYVLDSGGIAVVDLGSGLVQRSALVVDPLLPAVTAFGGGVVVWSERGAGTPRRIAYGSTDALATDGELARSRRFLPGPDFSVWASRTRVTDAPRRTTWRLVDESGSTTARTELTGQVVTDGSGGLFGLDRDRVSHVTPGHPPETWEGDVLAVGPDGFATTRCAQGRCPTLVHDRGSGRETSAARLPAVGLGLGALAPGNRFVAAVARVSPDRNGPVEVRVTEPGTGRLLRAFDSPEQGSSMVWLSNRWLAATSQRGLVLYDAVDDRLVRPDLGLTLPLQVVFTPG